MNKHPYSNRAIPSCEMARTFLFIYDRFDGNSSADMLEKSMTDWIKGSKPARKNMYYPLKRLCQLKLSTRSFAGLIPDSRSFNFQPTFTCSFMAVFSFFVRFFRFFELVYGHFHGLGLFIPKMITLRKMLAWWLINGVASSNPVKVVSVDCITSEGCQSRGKLLLPA